MEKLKPMVITDPEAGKEYTLEFNRKSVIKAEQAGLDINQLESKSMTMIPILFWGAFLMHHPHMTREQTDKILFEYLGGMPDGMAERLGALYSAPFDALNAKDGKPKNARSRKKNQVINNHN